MSLSSILATRDFVARYNCNPDHRLKASQFGLRYLRNSWLEGPSYAGRLYAWVSYLVSVSIHYSLYFASPARCLWLLSFPQSLHIHDYEHGT
ncbi:hypothetical protein BDZ94DRAFT_1277881 [Collybia nuda]|uniref:Uncharacterized protein n=1 Tax=Collybia nuda TaxID=64659 RepID=A0A9P5XR74_9AGAR|nr:hypothetical protein BDZ94DRAFT_1278055 [Collybia nuda]KAF9455580.1 hypothetical protein BDZ94DRAFT_1277881 [Collybia nuda]